jgi:hypothetical protein
VVSQYQSFRRVSANLVVTSESSQTQRGRGLRAQLARMPCVAIAGKIGSTLSGGGGARRGSIMPTAGSVADLASLRRHIEHATEAAVR